MRKFFRKASFKYDDVVRKFPGGVSSTGVMHLFLMMIFWDNVFLVNGEVLKAGLEAKSSSFISRLLLFREPLGITPEPVESRLK